MTDWHNSRIFHLALAFAMTLSILLAPFGHAASHDPAALALAEVERHAALADKDDGHGHDDGWPGEHLAGHSHGHDPADHSHDVPVPADFGGHAFLQAGNSRHVAAPFPHDRGPTFGIERPPRA